MGLLKQVFNSNERDIARLRRKIEKINGLEAQFEHMSDEELQAMTPAFRQRLENGEKLDDLLPEAFAVVREAAKRVLGQRHYDVQLMGGIVLHEGRVAEMKTGEGKTLVASLPSYLNGLTGKGVHVVTVNDYLAKRDAEITGQVHRFLGLTVGYNGHDMTPQQKREAYAADVTYGTNNEFGFDYLRDNMVMSLEDMVQRPLHFAIVDEVDSILIDEARTPLIISGPAEKSADLYFRADLFVRRLRRDEDYEIDEKMRTANLTDSGVHKAEQYFKVENLFDPDNVTLMHHITQALKAHGLMHRDKDYVVMGDEICIVDEFTGRLMEGRRYSEGLHQAIEAKEGVRVQNESKTLATITLQNYFRMYNKLSGMTGTAKTEEKEFIEIYGMDVVTIPTNRPLRRQDLGDVIYKTEAAKFNAVVNEIAARHEKGQPVLVGTTSVDKSERLSQMLHAKGVPHQVLNAKHHAREAEIVSLAGQPGMVTIATNMAGRGTDILLGEGVAEVGGLHIIGTERHESRRIDNQLRGRAGRQGDPGSSQFFLSLEDDLLRLFGSENIKRMMDRLGLEEDQPIEHRMLTSAMERAQKKVEGNNYDTRKHVLRYDDVMNKQREVIYKQRRQILETENLRGIIEGMGKDLISHMLDVYCSEEQIPEDWDIKGLLQYAERHFLTPGQVQEEDLRKLERDELQEKLQALFVENYDAREEELGDFLRQLERLVLLRTVDSKWMDHIDAMDQFRQGVHLRSYGQADPLVIYQREGFEMFEAMIHSIEEEVVLYVFKATVQQAPQPIEMHDSVGG
ncbi:preprotein translocase subunit SecA [Alicyclobacillus acidoterrestris]|uniref:Protein translocase subunit SecA n=1 Tax=Alicyclobacillus acidoterrestris (strain ATCC 49025 / DSM 3922 / CIP 106132 / NCIMB 13137 / GD3B) TaxID=1356854 RepID=T0CVD5_ALIAG|nr:preprotein translocase subunit SecA [Alicyclobacillus acidoterrestris]EPZ43357.1 preprotein translocase subunit SecA [Alicyclobacillus acidoterrestris ATCC 49025]UNO48792.1 preprotein translocase subunit SecA [Alicyclobacillus acidoterrestris]GEO26664.1 protein translocase subunit SecA 1 [Alicyclobacillus acidoterrestris]